MRIAMLAPELPQGSLTGGIAEATVSIADALIEAGVDVDVFAPHANRATRRQRKDHRWNLHWWDVNRRDRAFYYAARLRSVSWRTGLARARSRAAMRELRRVETTTGWTFDVIDSWLWQGLGTVPATGSSRHALVTRIATPDFLTTGSNDASFPRDLKRLQQRTLDGSHAIITLTAANLKTFMEQFSIDEQKVRRVPLFSDLPADRRTVAPSECTDVVCVGRLERRKGTDVLIKGACQFLGAHSETSLVLIGREAEPAPSGGSYSEYIKRMTAPDVARRIHIRGHCSTDELSSALRNAAVAVVPSRYESFGIVAVEAMSHGTPLVASDVGGLGEIVDPTCGILVPPEDPQALGAAIRDLLQDGARRDRLGRAGEARASSEFSSQAVVDATLSAYQFAVSNARRGQRVPRLTTQ